MLIYEKGGHLYYAEDNIPSEDDVQLSYKKASDGSVIEGVTKDTYVYQIASSLLLNLNTKNQVPNADTDIGFTVWAGGTLLLGTPD